MWLMLVNPFASSDKIQNYAKHDFDIYPYYQPGVEEKNSLVAPAKTLMNARKEVW